MSNGPVENWRVILHTYPCATCGAVPGASCRSPSGKPQHMPHVDRYNQAHERDWRAGDDVDDVGQAGRNEWERDP